MKKILTLLTLVSALSATASLAAPAGSTSASMAPEKRWGTYVALGNPYPSLLGLNGAYNVTDNIRAVVGYGEVEVTSTFSSGQTSVTSESVKAQTYAVGADYLMTDWAIRPNVGARVGYFDISGDGEMSVQGIDKSTGLLYGNLGFDYVADGGFYAATGVNVSVVGGEGTNFYANLGYFF